MTRMTKKSDAPAAAGATAPTGRTAMAPTTDTTVRRPRAGDWVFAVVVLAVFVAGFFLSQDWPFRAALFPMMVTVAGAVLSLFKIIGLALQAVRGRRSVGGVAVVPSQWAAELPAQPVDSSPEGANVRTAAVAAEGKRAEGTAQVTPDDVQIVDDEQEEDASMEYVFASAGGRSWAEAMAWVTAFFVSFFVLGAYITVPVYAFAYLLVAGKAKWWAALIYAVVTGLIIFVVFREVVFIPLPESPFPGLGF
ncbi:tripartite tricarboxylate transporter TctB family protein [Modestobacter muralis]|uniref:Tripartite tricarboxylate transporter TctB family protein n=1 Tax=Modestobacter muralis TaxID=1608614 RepID=A0A6P0EW06_9ACTN|nr:tripartite tricarboxylate transporter TctB family protein [Modestobacter muralis]NEK95245.1 tripartite tricarboxylate transporter TctB family protein [Modestobacter muralis]NEN52133.1 tripartite tricarboxylate transporter TctB family protein [Modestobacter muralis]